MPSQNPPCCPELLCSTTHLHVILTLNLDKTWWSTKENYAGTKSTILSWVCSLDYTHLKSHLKNQSRWTTFLAEVRQARGGWILCSVPFTPLYVAFLQATGISWMVVFWHDDLGEIRLGRVLIWQRWGTRDSDIVAEHEASGSCQDTSEQDEECGPAIIVLHLPHRDNTSSCHDSRADCSP